jgi:predicted metalloprotease with PDZ domain
MRHDLNLDGILRELWQRCRGGPMSQADLLAQLQASSGRSFEAEIGQWVHTTEELPVQALLESHGVAVVKEPDQLAQRLGMRVEEGQGLKVKTVLHGGPAHAAGLSAGDEWLAIERADGSGWRLRRLDDLFVYAKAGDKVKAVVSRDEQLLRLPLKVPEAGHTWRLAVQDAALLERWIAAPPNP